MLQHKTLAYADGKARKPKLRRELFFTLRDRTEETKAGAGNKV